MSQQNDQLEPLELAPWRVLVVAAHPGDIEYAASPVVAKWTKEGAEVIYLVATRGELSIPGVEPEEAALIRSGEQSAAAAAVGVHVVDFLDIDDGTIEASVRLRRSIVRDIRHFRPDVVMVMNHREREPDGTWNDADHRAVGVATLDAVSASANQWAFRDVGPPHRVDHVLVAASPMSTHAIDISGFEPDAVTAYTAHERHLAALADHPMAGSDWLVAEMRANAARLPGSVAALAVEPIEYDRGRPCHSPVVAEADYDGGLQFAETRAGSDASNTRARNAKTPKARRSKKSAPPVSDGAMKFKAVLEKNGRSVGIEIPDNVMSRIGNERTPNVVVEINDITFDAKVITSTGKRFVVINTERRKAAGIEVDETLFVALTSRSQPKSEEGVETPSGSDVDRPERSRRRRRSGRGKTASR